MCDTSRCHIAKCTPEALAAKLKEALRFTGKTNGRERIIRLGLDNKQVASRIIAIYKQLTD